MCGKCVINGINKVGLGVYGFMKWNISIISFVFCYLLSVVFLIFYWGS